MRELSRLRPRVAGEKSEQKMDDWSPLDVVKAYCMFKGTGEDTRKNELTGRQGNGEPVIGPAVVDLVVSTGKRRGGRKTAAKGKTVGKERRNWWSTAQVPIDRRSRSSVAQSPARTKQCSSGRVGERGALSARTRPATAGVS
jgi:hypothetical protein